jgi:hypothetical protein
MKMPIIERVAIAELRCMQCSRVAGKARLWPDGWHVAGMAPGTAEAVRRRRCPACLGNLRLEDTSTEELMVRRRFTPDELVVKKGRPQKAVQS